MKLELSCWSSTPSVEFYSTILHFWCSWYSHICPIFIWGDKCPCNPKSAPEILFPSLKSVLLRSEPTCHVRPELAEPQLSWIPTPTTENILARQSFAEFLLPILVSRQPQSASLTGLYKFGMSDLIKKKEKKKASSQPQDQQDWLKQTESFA